MLMFIVLTPCLALGVADLLRFSDTWRTRPPPAPGAAVRLMPWRWSSVLGDVIAVGCNDGQAG